MSLPATDWRGRIYLIVTGAGSARAAPTLLRALARLGPGTICITTENAARIVAPRELVAAVEGLPGEHRVVESYFDEAIRPPVAPGLVLVAPCSFASLNKLALGIADNLALSVVSEAIGRGQPVLVAPSLNAGLRAHPRTGRSLDILVSWGVEIVPGEAVDGGLVLPPVERLVAAVRRHLEACPSARASG